MSAPRVFYLLLAGATALEREELTLPDSAAAAACTSAGEALQREDVPSRAKAFGLLTLTLTLTLALALTVTLTLAVTLAVTLSLTRTRARSRTRCA